MFWAKQNSVPARFFKCRLADLLEYFHNERHAIPLPVKTGSLLAQNLMKSPGKKTLVAFTTSVAVTAAFIATYAQSPSVQPPNPADQQYKTIKVLNGLPADQVIPAMQFITASLGVDCEYCHVREGHAMAFDKDDKKPKLAARKMMQMMSAINKDNFDGKREVTCYSCHRGAADPVATPVVSEEERGPEAPAEKRPGDAQAARPSANQLLDKYLAAVGGAEAVQKISSRVEKGTLNAFGGQHFPAEIYAKAPGRRLSIMHLPGGDSVTAFDGHSGWLSVPG